MRSALVALLAATTFFVGAFKVGGGGKESPLPGRIDAGEGTRAGVGAVSSSPEYATAGFEVVPSLVREEPVTAYEPAQGPTAPVAADRRSAPLTRADEDMSASDVPQPTPAPSSTPTAAPSPTATTAPSPSASPSPAE